MWEPEVVSIYLYYICAKFEKNSLKIDGLVGKIKNVKNMEKTS